jgi:hypothetical protein
MARRSPSTAPPPASISTSSASSISHAGARSRRDGKSASSFRISSTNFQVSSLDHGMGQPFEGVFHMEQSNFDIFRGTDDKDAVRIGSVAGLSNLRPSTPSDSPDRWGRYTALVRAIPVGVNSDGAIRIWFARISFRHRLQLSQCLRTSRNCRFPCSAGRVSRRGIPRKTCPSGLSPGRDTPDSCLRQERHNRGTSEWSYRTSNSYYSGRFWSGFSAQSSRGRACRLLKSEAMVAKCAVAPYTFCRRAAWIVVATGKSDPKTHARSSDVSKGYRGYPEETRAQVRKAEIATRAALSA